MDSAYQDITNFNFLVEIEAFDTKGVISINELHPRRIH